MRLLIVSDIHANLQALEACSDCLPAYDFVWNLGDVVGYGANPNEAVARSRQLGAIFVRGNHDKACSGVSDLDGFNPVAALAAIWTQQQLKPENLEWLRKLPQGPVRPNLELDLACVHGAPGDEDEYLINAQDAAGALAHPIAPVTFFGHTHLQGGFMRNATNVHGIHPQYRTKDQPERIELRLENDKSYMINPGSIGQPRDGDPRAAFALYETDERVVTFYRVPYDIEGAQKTILGAGLPPRLASRLAEGR